MKALHALLAGAALLLAACTTAPPAGAPEGFARYQGGDALEAVSAERVIYRVREIDNQPEADAGFWQLALKERLRKGGYVIVGEGEVQAGTRRGHYVETTAARGALDYSYLVAIFVQGKRITVIEAGGELKAYGAQRERIFAALRQDAQAASAASAR